MRFRTGSITFQVVFWQEFRNPCIHFISEIWKHVSDLKQMAGPVYDADCKHGYQVMAVVTVLTMMTLLKMMTAMIRVLTMMTVLTIMAMMK